MRGYHDIGGLNAGAIDRSQHDFAAWEKRVDAMMELLKAKGLLTLDELRRGIEIMGADKYERSTYYEKWISGICHTMVARGLVTTDELGRRMTEAARRATA